MKQKNVLNIESPKTKSPEPPLNKGVSNLRLIVPLILTLGSFNVNALANRSDTKADLEDKNTLVQKKDAEKNTSDSELTGENLKKRSEQIIVMINDYLKLASFLAEGDPQNLGSFIGQLVKRYKLDESLSSVEKLKAILSYQEKELTSYINLLNKALTNMQIVSALDDNKDYKGKIAQTISTIESMSNLREGIRKMISTL